MDLSKKKKILNDVMNKMNITEPRVNMWLDDMSVAEIPLNSSLVADKSLINGKYVEEVKIAKTFSLLIHVDELISLGKEGVAVKLYKNQSESLKLEFIEWYMKREPIYELEYFTLWQKMFRVDTAIISLYASIIYRGMKNSEQQVKFKLTEFIDDDKAFVLSHNLQQPIIKHELKFRAFGFIPQSPLQPMNMDTIKSLVSDTAIVILLYKTISSIEIDTWLLRDLGKTKQLLGEYAVNRGLTSGILTRCTNIRYLESESKSDIPITKPAKETKQTKKDKQTKRSKHMYEILGDREKYTEGYVLETLGGDKWRYLCPFSSGGSYSVAKYKLEPFLMYLTTNRMSKIAAYNKHQHQLILNKMFFSRTMQPSVEYLESLAQDADMSSVKHNLTIALEQLLKTNAKMELKSFYHVLSYLQTLNIKETITSVLLDEFRNLSQYEEFTSILEKSSFPTSEILLSYIVEMQKFAHILYKAFIDNMKDKQHDFDTKSIPLDQIINAAIKDSIDEKIRQEGSIMNIINFKSRLLYIDKW